MKFVSPFSIPDLGFEFSPGVAPEREAALLQSLASSLPPGADVRTASSKGSTRFAVWLRPTSDPGDEEVRAEGLDDLALLRSGESFAARFKAECPWFSAQSAVVAAGSDDHPALRLLPGEILIAGGQKVVLDYRSLEVGPDGLRGGGSWMVTERKPAVAIVSPKEVTAEFPDLTCMAQFRLRATDLRPPFREIRWTAKGVVANPRARSTPILFEVRGARPQQLLPRQVWVQVTDADGLTVLAQEMVVVRVTWNDSEATFGTAEPEPVTTTCLLKAC